MTNLLMTFTAAGSRYALPSDSLVEVLRVPLLSRIEGAPAHEIGVFDLRGSVVNVIDLNLRFSHTRQPIHSSDYLAIVNTSFGLAGVLINQLNDFIDAVLLDSHRETQLADDFDPLISGFIEHNGEMVMVLAVDELLKRETDECRLTESEPFEVEHLSKEDIAQLRARSEQYRQAVAYITPAETQQIVLVRVHEEALAFSLDPIIEFAPLSEIYPIPFTSQQIIGCMNLRGEIVVVVDLLPSLGLKAMTRTGQQSVIICSFKEEQIGILVDEVQRIVSIEDNELHTVPVSMSAEQAQLYLGEVNLDSDKCLVVNTQAFIDNPDVLTTVFSGLSE